MTALWLNSQSERLVAAYLADARPAWLWAADGEKRIWRNRAALAFEAAHRREDKARLVPVPRQIPRLIRLGVPLSGSPARLQFTLGRKPVSATCVCTPLYLRGNVSGLLAVMSEPVPETDLFRIDYDAASLTPFVGETSHYVLTGSDGAVLLCGGAGSARLEAGQDPVSELKTGARDSRLILFPEMEPEPKEAETTAPNGAEETTPNLETTQDTAAAPETTDAVTPEATTEPAARETEAGETGETLLGLFDRLADRKVLYEPLDERDDAPFVSPEAPEPETFAPADPQDVSDPEKETPAQIDEPQPVETYETVATDAEPAPVETVKTESDETPLPVEDSAPVKTSEVVTDTESAPAESEDPESGETTAPVENPAPAEISEVATDAEPAPVETENTETNETPVEDASPVRLWRVIGRNLLERQDADARQTAETTEEDASSPSVTTQEDTPESSAKTTDASDAEAGEADKPAKTDETTAEKEDAPQPDDIPPEPPQDADVIEQTSRYNFDELSRILTDRVSGDAEKRRDWLPEPATRNDGALVNLGDETLILNRLPIGLLVFRDQQILFSNRALTDLLGYVDGTSLRTIGLGGIFPNENEQSAGPVTRLVGSDGQVLHVSARLQTISWQGKPALLLSASRQKEPLNAEDMARGFAEMTANAMNLGYFETNRAGILTSISGRGALLSGRSPNTLIGRPIHNLIALSQGSRLRSFLEQPARFAGMERPAMRFAGAEAGTEVVLFAAGMAGIVKGYFGLLRKSDTTAHANDTSRSIDPNFLIRLGRAIRQPVTAIIGFAEMIQNQTFGPIGNSRYTDYAKFIRNAGQDVASVVDELEHYANLRTDTYPVETARIDLVDLLEQTIHRVRPFAGTRRVLVRSGISSSLPEITADRATLTQAVLNILASAIAHSQRGSQVVLSAQKRSDNGVEIHVRDSGAADSPDMDDRFMVFRDGAAADGEALMPIQSTIGLALTQSLLAVNSSTLEIDPGPGNGTLFTLVIPAELTVGADSVRG